MIRAGGSSGSGRPSVRVGWGAALAAVLITGAEAGGAVRTGVESPRACWKNARCAARVSAGARADGVVLGAGGGL